MSEVSVEGSSPPEGRKTAGMLLREARQAQGMHIAALAAAIKVAPRKLEALEGDRHDELVDATFTRALAMTVCRALKIDPAPILERLPQSDSKGLDQVSAGLNASFRERAGRREATDWRALNRPAVWGAVALLVGAAAVVLVPARWTGLREWVDLNPTPAAAPASAASVPGIVPSPSQPASEPAAASATATLRPAPSVAASTPASAVPPVSASGAGAAAAPASAAAGLLKIETTTGGSWIEVRDAAGKTLLSRLVPPGESLAVDGDPPLRVKIGHAAVTRLTFRGQPVPLSPSDTVVRMELK